MDRSALEVVLGRYALGEVLGHGGSATVYRAWDRRAERAVALKRFALGADGPDRHRQRAEVRTLARLDHPGLVRLLDAGTENGRAHLVMDLVEGPSLAQRLADGCLPVADLVALGSSLAEALAYIHAEEITHRDVKPANVLLDPVHGPRLADFGIARLVDSTRVTATDAVVGTAAYMAPEQLRGTAVGPAADVYALGLVLLEAATGGLGLPGTGLEVVLTRLTTAPSVPDEVPAPLRTLLRTMTDGSPQRRPSARQVAAALGVLEDDPESCAELGPVTTATIAAPVRRRPMSGPKSRRRGRAAAGGALVAAATATLIVLGVAGGPTTGAGAVIATP
ncbi:MAG: eukaryotic-like serine/threonine-protein kinase, partial [Actinomycetota bacterium]|nr:eukaryotic-like serine/threonine-protein kinase [Actinomycetota bacterium]